MTNSVHIYDKHDIWWKILTNTKMHENTNAASKNIPLFSMNVLEFNIMIRYLWWSSK